MTTATTTLPTTNQPPSLSHSTFAKLSPTPYLLAHLIQNPPSRPNTRSPTQSRPPHINTSSLTHASGSSVVRCGDTTVVCGVRAEILPISNAPSYRPSPNTTTLDNNIIKDLSLVVPNIELSTGCSPSHLPGSAPSSLAQTLSTRIYTLLTSSSILDPSDLIIYSTTTSAEGETTQEVKGFWCLYIDTLYISLDGSPFDTAWHAVLAALLDTRLPLAEWDADTESILCSSSLSSSKRLTLNGLPIASTYAVFRGTIKNEEKYWVLSDPDAFEEELCEESVCVVMDCTGGGERILGISKAGGGTVGREEMRSVLALGAERWKEWKAVMEV